MSLKTAFPFPFGSPFFQYTNNLRRLDPPVSVQITEEYQTEVNLRRELLFSYPERCYQSQPGTLGAQWEVLDHLLHELASVYPSYFSLSVEGSHWSFTNVLLGETTDFIFADEASLGFEPLDFVGRHVQEDLILLRQIGDELSLVAGQLCFPSNWSLNFDLGMQFVDIHRPVPGIIEQGLVGKIQRFLTRIEAGKPWTRLNWSLSAGDRLDTSAETFDEWGSLRHQVDSDNVGSLVHLRVEEQNLIRMPGTDTLLFTIHTYLRPVQAICSNSLWRELFLKVLQTLPEEVSQYKGIEPFYDTLLTYLENEVARK